jgi:hypothetical protein
MLKIINWIFGLIVRNFTIRFAMFVTCFVDKNFSLASIDASPSFSYLFSSYLSFEIEMLNNHDLSKINLVSAICTVITVKLYFNFLDY